MTCDVGGWAISQIVFFLATDTHIYEEFYFFGKLWFVIIADGYNSTCGFRGKVEYLFIENGEINSLATRLFLYCVCQTG